MQTAPLTTQAMISRAQPLYFAIIRMKHPSVGLQENMRLKMKTEMTIIQKWSPRLLSGKQATAGQLLLNVKGKNEANAAFTGNNGSTAKGKFHPFCYAVRGSHFTNIACLWKNVRSVQELRT